MTKGELKKLIKECIQEERQLNDGVLEIAGGVALGILVVTTVIPVVGSLVLGTLSGLAKGVHAVAEDKRAMEIIKSNKELIKSSLKKLRDSSDLKILLGNIRQHDSESLLSSESIMDLLNRHASDILSKEEQEVFKKITQVSTFNRIMDDPEFKE